MDRPDDALDSNRTGHDNHSGSDPPAGPGGIVWPARRKSAKGRWIGLPCMRPFAKRARSARFSTERQLQALWGEDLSRWQVVGLLALDREE